MKKKVLSLVLTSVLAVGMLAGCSKKSEVQNSSTAASPVTINFVYWASTDAEENTFKSLITKFEGENPNIKVNGQSSAFKDFYTKVETRIAGNDSPDAMRIQYQQLGRYAAQGTLIDLTKQLPQDFSKDFNKALWSAVSYKNSVFALPHHTDTGAVFYNKTYFDKLGIKAPDKLENAWTMDEFLNIAKRLKTEGGAKYGLALNWRDSNSYRWLPFLYMNGGKLLSDDLTKCEIDSPEAIDTIKTTASFFKTGLTPAGDSVKGTEDQNTLFATGAVGMLINGNWMIPYFEKNMTQYQFGITYMPKGKSAAADLGGNALGVLSKSKHQAEALKFIEFMTREDNMKDFVEKGMFLPARTTISSDKLNYPTKPEYMKVFVDQATTIPTDMAKVISLPSMTKMNKVLSDNLEEAFTQGKNEVDTAKTMKSQIDEILKEK